MHGQATYIGFHRLSGTGCEFDLSPLYHRGWSLPQFTTHPNNEALLQWRHCLAHMPRLTTPTLPATDSFWLKQVGRFWVFLEIETVVSDREALYGTLQPFHCTFTSSRFQAQNTAKARQWWHWGRQRQALSSRPVWPTKSFRTGTKN